MNLSTASTVIYLTEFFKREPWSLQAKMPLCSFLKNCAHPAMRFNQYWVQLPTRHEAPKKMLANYSFKFQPCANLQIQNPAL